MDMSYGKYVFFLSELVRVVNMNGRLKSSKRQAAQLNFDFRVESLGKKMVMFNPQNDFQNIDSFQIIFLTKNIGINLSNGHISSNAKTNFKSNKSKSQTFASSY